MNAFGGSRKVWGKNQRAKKSQARATIFLVLFMLLIPAVLAIDYTGSITGVGVTGDAVVADGTSTEADASPQADVRPEQQMEAPAEPEPEQPEIPEPQGLEQPKTSAEPEQTEPSQEPENQTEPEPQPDLCEGAVCSGITAACPDGYEAVCMPECDQSTGECAACEPDCSEHQIGQTEPPANQTEPPANTTKPTTNQTTTNQTEPPANTTEPITNQTTNQTDINTTEPQVNQTVPGIPLPGPCNETNVTCGECEILDEYNCTCVANESCQKPGQPIPEVPVPGMPEPTFRISLDPPARVTRGSTVRFVAAIENMDTGIGNATNTSASPTAFNVNPYWIMPEGMQLIATDNDCSTLLPGSACTITGYVYVEPGTIGSKEIRILVDYE